MNLRNVTIWTTGVVWLLAIVPPVLGFFSIRGEIESNLVLMCFSLPFLKAYFIARNLQCVIPAGILLFSTFVYGIVYVLLCTVQNSDGAIFLLRCIFPWLPLMVPLWIVAYTIEVNHRKKKTEP